MIYTFTGKNSFALKNTLRSVESSFVKEFGDIAVERHDAQESDADTILQSVQSTPFLSEKKLVIISNLSANTPLVERIGELLDRCLESNEIYVVDQKLDKRTALYKLLKKQTELKDFIELSSQDLPTWVREQVMDGGGSISPTDAAYLVDRVGSDQLLLHQEVQKLILYNEEISKESIELLVDPSVQSTIFELLDAAFSGNKERAVELYREQRSAKVDPTYIIAMLTWQLHNVSLALFADPQNEATLKTAGLAPFTAKKSLQLARRTNKQDLKKMIFELSNLDLKLKSSTLDADAALEFYLLEIISS
jgi:DNA polymerase-3 subunit delta